MNEADTIRITRQFDSAIQAVNDMPVDEFRQLLQNDPFGMQRTRFDTIVNLTNLNATSQIALAIPAGSVIQYVAARIISLVVAGGTTAAIGIGSSTSVSKYGFTASLVVNQHIQGLYASNGASAGENIGVIANVSGGGTIGGGNITAGRVHLRVIYDSPMALTS
jgi:hypothetical protein